LLFIGLATFERLLQLAIENIRCVVAINRLRHYYLEIAPELSHTSPCPVRRHGRRPGQPRLGANAPAALGLVSRMRA